MKYIITKERGKPAYLQLYNQLRNDILSGVLPHGSKLPSKRLISEELGISVITAEHAYAMLCDEGYILSKERSGYFVCSDGPVFFSAAPTTFQHNIPEKRKTSDIADAADFPFSVYAKTIRRVLSEYGEKIIIKTPGKGCAELQNAIRDYLARARGITVQSEQIVIGSGAEYLYSLITQLFGRDKIYGIESPSYEKIEQIYRANGVKYEKLKLSGDGITSAALKNSNAEILHVTPFHSFPSGISASASKRAEYVDWAYTRSGYIIEDDYESEFSVFSKPADTIYSIAPEGRIIYVNTFSKSLSAAMRIGYMILPESLLEIYEQKLGFYSCTVPSFDQYILADFIDSGELERHINRTRRKFRKQKEKA